MRVPINGAELGVEERELFQATVREFLLAAVPEAGGVAA